MGLPFHCWCCFFAGLENDIHAKREETKRMQADNAELEDAVKHTNNIFEKLKEQLKVWACFCLLSLRFKLVPVMFKDACVVHNTTFCHKGGPPSDTHGITLFLFWKNQYPQSCQHIWSNLLRLKMWVCSYDVQSTIHSFDSNWRCWKVMLINQTVCIRLKQTTSQKKIFELGVVQKLTAWYVA